MKEVTSFLRAWSINDIKEHADMLGKQIVQTAILAENHCKRFQSKKSGKTHNYNRLLGFIKDYIPYSRKKNLGGLVV